MSTSEIKTATNAEEAQEMELKAKYPGLARQGAGSLLLQKRLNRGHKFFDSGDYNMARAKTSQSKLNTPAQTLKEEVLLQEATGVTIATPESVPAVRKKSMIGGIPSFEGSTISQSNLVSPRGSIVAQTTCREPEHHPE